MEICRRKPILRFLGAVVSTVLAGSILIPAASANSEEPGLPAQRGLFAQVGDLLVMLGSTDDQELFGKETPGAPNELKKASKGAEITFELPKLEGLSSSLSTKFNDKVAALADEAVAEFVKTDRGYCMGGEQPPYKSVFSVKPLHTGVYQNRYVSASLAIGSSYCGGVWNSSTMATTFDTFTEREVPSKTFTDLSSGLTKLAAMRNADANVAKCSPEADFGFLSRMPEPEAWQPSSEGMYMFYEKYALGAGACGSPEILVPWGELAKDSELTGKPYEQIFVSGFKARSRSQDIATANLTSVLVQGRQVVVGSFAVPGDGVCLYGVRDGDKVLLSSSFDGLGNEPTILEFESDKPGAKSNIGSLNADGSRWTLITDQQSKQLRETTGARLSSKETCQGMLEEIAN